jgi:uncharacterized membrane protein YccC
LELDTPTIASFSLGLAAGFLVLALLLPYLSRRLRLRYRRQVEDYEQVIVDLRQERADDREINRRLRRELAVSTPEHLVSTREELAVAVGDGERMRSELHHSARQLGERDRSLREARLAIHEIRVQLEQDRVEGDNGSEYEHPLGEATTP